MEEDSSSRAKDRTKGVPVAQQQLFYLSKGSYTLMNDKRALAFYGAAQSTKFNNDQLLLVWKKVAEGVEQQENAEEEESEDEKEASSADAPSASGADGGVLELSVMTLAADQPARCTIMRRPGHCTIRAIKKGLHKATGFDVAQMRVRRTVGGEVLADEQTLSGAGFVDGDVLLNDLLSLTVAATLLRDAGDTITFDLFADGRTTISELKQRVAARADGYPVEWQWADLIAPTDSPPLNPQQIALVAASVDDEQPLSQYGVGSADGRRANLLICRRPQPRPKQHNEREIAAQPDQLLRLRARVTATNDLYELRALAWQPLVAVRWQLAALKAADFDSQRLVLCPPAASSSTARRPLSDDFASLRSLGVTDGAVLQVDRSDVPLMLTLPPDVAMHRRPLGNGSYSSQNALHAQLSDTVRQLKARLQSLTGLPADRQLFRFHRLLPVDVDDSLTLAQLGFATRDPIDKLPDPSLPQTHMPGDSNHLTVRLLPGPAAQPPTAEQQFDVGLKQVGVRVLASSSRVYRMWLLRSETTANVQTAIVQQFGQALQSLSAFQHLGVEGIALAVGGRKAAESDRVADMIRECDDVLPIIGRAHQSSAVPAASR